MNDTVRHRPVGGFELGSGTFSGEGGDITYRIDWAPGLDVGVGNGLGGADLEVTYNQELAGVDVDVMGALGGWAGIGSVSIGWNGISMAATGGRGGIVGIGAFNVDGIVGTRYGVDWRWWTGDVSSSVVGVATGSVGAGIVEVNVDIAMDFNTTVDRVNGGNSTTTPRPTDTAIQTSRDIVAGRLVDSSTGKTVYPDAIIRDVAAAKKKREQEIAAAAAWQREHNRDRQDSSSSASTPSPTPQTATGPVNTTTRSESAHWTQSNNTGNNPGNPNASGYHARPIVIDLDGDGVEISPLGGSTARFDYDGDGFDELTAWAGADQPSASDSPASQPRNTH